MYQKGTKMSIVSWQPEGLQVRYWLQGKRVYTPMPSGATSRLLKASQIANIMAGPAKGLIALIGTFYGSIVFALFIMEEAIQAAGFGVWTLVTGRVFDKAEEQLRKYIQLIVSMEKLIDKVDVFFGLRIDISDLTDEERDLVGPFLDSTGSLGRDLLLEPFIHFVIASRGNAMAYEARIAASKSSTNPQYYQKNDELERSIELDKFKLKQGQDEALDKLRIEKMQAADELAAEVKRETNKLMAQKKAKEIDQNQYEEGKAVITAAKNEQEIAIKTEFDEKERAVRLQYFDSFYVLERVEENKREALRSQFFPRIEEGGAPPEIPPTAPPEIYTAAVTHIVDGDTFDTADFRIRLVGINSAELGTAQGTKDTNALALLISGKTVTIKSDPSHVFDVYGRVLAVVFIGNVNINIQMLKTGNAALDLREPHKYVDENAFKAAVGAPPAPPGVPPVIEVPELPSDKQYIIWPLGIMGSVTGGIFAPPLPFDTPTEQKINADVSGREAQYESFPINHEMMAVTIRMDGKWTNPEDITLRFRWFRDGENSPFFQHTGTMGKPSESGYNYWTWWRWRSWVGKDLIEKDEVLAPGIFYCEIDFPNETWILGNAKIYFRVV